MPDYPLDGRAYVFVMYGVIQCLVRPAVREPSDVRLNEARRVVWGRNVRS